MSLTELSHRDKSIMILGPSTAGKTYFVQMCQQWLEFYNGDSPMWHSRVFSLDLDTIGFADPRTSTWRFTELKPPDIMPAIMCGHADGPERVGFSNRADKSIVLIPSIEQVAAEVKKRDSAQGVLDKAAVRIQKYVDFAKTHKLLLIHRGSDEYIEAFNEILAWADSQAPNPLPWLTKFVVDIQKPPYWRNKFNGPTTADLLPKKGLT